MVGFGFIDFISQGKLKFLSKMDNLHLFFAQMGSEEPILSENKTKSLVYQNGV